MKWNVDKMADIRIVQNFFFYFDGSIQKWDNQ